ncbi:hypothetical protein B0G84_3245 [Paraburkholderia sp. BL8N3]|nr:hypothetical protein [Paraburkholderia sp. BL8N3]TCK37947.1 hypothetical protein B0G84_3245 [Paraburkholderia sp. BL8N3]
MPDAFSLGDVGVWIGLTRDGADASPKTSLNYVRAAILFEM